MDEKSAWFYRFERFEKSDTVHFSRHVFALFRPFETFWSPTNTLTTHTSRFLTRETKAFRCSCLEVHFSRSQHLKRTWFRFALRWALQEWKDQKISDLSENISFNAKEMTTAQNAHEFVCSNQSTPHFHHQDIRWLICVSFIFPFPRLTLISWNQIRSESFNILRFSFHTSKRLAQHHIAPSDIQNFRFRSI